MKISDRVSKIAESATLAITTLARSMRAEGKKIIPFSAGEPDFDTPACIREAAKKAIDDGYTRYTPTTGLPELKKAICHKFESENSLMYKPDQIIVSCGAKHSLFNAILALCEEGDEVLLPVPYWVTYLEQIALAGATPVPVYCRQDTLEVEPDALRESITPRTRVLVLNNPVNPTGVVYSEKTLAEIAELSLQHDITIISDEIYEHLVYDQKPPPSIASLDPEMGKRTIVVNGVSKTFAMTGWRIGYSAGPYDAVQAMSRLQDHTTSNPTTISQIAAQAALQCPQEIIQSMVETFNRRRTLMSTLMNALPDVSFPFPRGAFYIFADFSAYLGKYFCGNLLNSSFDLAQKLLREAGVACVPGSAFGMEGFLRFSYATSEDNIETGMKQLRSFLENLT